jgi:Amt family ammonium transporter
MNSGNLSWYLMATALVLFMTPGLAFFYGGLVRARSVVNMLMLSFGAMGMVGELWVLYGFNLQNVSTGWVGFAGNPLVDPALAQLAARPDGEAGLVGVAYGATFAVITVALISGAIADRAKFGAWLLFVALFLTIDYCPVAGWVWNPDGWIAQLGHTLGVDARVIDYAGGTAVHINAGAAALALALVLGRRVGFRRGNHEPHNIPLVLLGAGILWFGWFGFNGGAAAAGGGGIAASASPVGLIVVNTLAAASASTLGWIGMQRLSSGKVSAVGAASGAVAGLVAITPACANLAPGWALLLGFAAGALCAKAVGLKFLFGVDDSLDVVGVHLVGGLVGTLWLGFFATGTGLLVGGNLAQLTLQAIAAGTVFAFSFAVSWAIAWVIQHTIGFRVERTVEVGGIDRMLHGENGYAFPLDGTALDS